MKVAIAFPSYRAADERVAMSLMDTAAALVAHGVRWARLAVGGCPYLHRKQSLYAHMFMAGDADKLLWVEDDMSWRPEDVLMLLESPHDCTAADYAKKSAGAGMVARPMPGALADGPYAPCSTVGLGLTVMTRKAIEAVQSQSQHLMFVRAYDDIDAGQLGYRLFSDDFVNGTSLDPDVAFFRRMCLGGVVPYVDTRIRSVGHIGTHVYTEKDAHV